MPTTGKGKGTGTGTGTGTGITREELAKLETQEEELLNRVVDDMGIEFKKHKGRGFYGWISRQYELRTGTAIPKEALANMEQHDTCACTDGSSVYLHTPSALQMSIYAKERLVKYKTVPMVVERVEDLQTLLAHEYTHILMRHTERTAKFVKQYGTNDLTAFNMACEIEANRGYMVEERSNVYAIGVTEDTFPETKGIDGLMNIYRVLKQKYHDPIHEYAQAIRSNGGEGNGEEDKQTEKLSEEQKIAIEGVVKEEEQIKSRAQKLARALSAQQLDNIDLESSDPTVTIDHTHTHDHTNTEEATTTQQPKSVERIVREYENKLLEEAYRRNMQQVMDLVMGNDGVRKKVKTYSRQSRKHTEDGLIKKGTRYDKRHVPRVLVALDKSGSMCSARITPIATAIGTIANMTGKSQGSYICTHDEGVEDLQPLSQWEEVVDGYDAEGGNDFNEVLQTALDTNVQIVLNVGDGLDIMNDRKLMEQAHERGIKWVDILVCNVDQVNNRGECIRQEQERHGQNYIGRETINMLD